MPFESGVFENVVRHATCFHHRMRVAIPCWNGRISALFDVSTQLVLIDIEDGREVGRATRELIDRDPVARAGAVSRFGAELLICGALSKPLQVALLSSGVRIISWKCGPIDAVLEAYLGNGLLDPAFALPGALACGATSQHGSGHG